MCGYTNIGDVKWMRGSNASIGPDHSLDTSFGSYVYAEGQSKSVAHKGVILSTQFTPNREQCLEFYYQRNKYDGTSYLKVYTWKSDQRNNIPIWTESMSTNDIEFGWKRAQITLGHSLTTMPYQV